MPHHSCFQVVRRSSFAPSSPKLRRFALSTSLWCVACDPCSIAVLVGMVLAEKGADAIHNPMLHSIFSDQRHFALVCAAVVAMAGATIITLVHGWMIRRLTMNLFRLYLTGVTFGVGVLIALATGIALLINVSRLQGSTAFVYTVLLLSIPSLLAFFVYRNATGFRGKQPEFLNPISSGEFI